MKVQWLNDAEYAATLLKQEKQRAAILNTAGKFIHRRASVLRYLGKRGGDINHHCSHRERLFITS